MTPEEFSSAPGLLYHGTHKSFVFDRSYRYDSAHMYASAGGCTLGTGFYLTPDRFVAEHLSRKRREQLSMP